MKSTQMSDSDCQAKHPLTAERCHLQYDHDGSHVAWRGVACFGMFGIYPSGGSICWVDEPAKEPAE